MNQQTAPRPIGADVEESVGNRGRVEPFLGATCGVRYVSPGQTAVPVHSQLLTATIPERSRGLAAADHAVARRYSA